MKKKLVNHTFAAEPTEFTAAISTVQSSVNTTEPVSLKDKQGSKASEKELNLMSFAIDNLPKYQHKLARDFDENAFIAEYNETDQLITQRDEVQGILNHMNAKVTAKRVKLKIGYMAFYAAAQEATKENPALKYISDKLGEIYVSNTAMTDAPKDKSGETPKDKLGETPTV
jgi:hypothetical protein